MVENVIKVTTATQTIKVTGLPGLKGEKGDGAMLQHPSPIALGSNRVVAMTASGVDYADTLIPSEILVLSHF